MTSNKPSGPLLTSTAATRTKLLHFFLTSITIYAAEIYIFNGEQNELLWLDRTSTKKKKKNLLKS